MQNYTDVIVPKIEEAFRNLGAKFAGDPDVAIAYAGIGEMHNVIQFLYREGTQLHADHVQAIQVKQELDENLLQSVAELSVQTEKVRGLSKKAIKDVNTFIKDCTTVVMDDETTKTVYNEFFAKNSGRSAKDIKTSIKRHESDIEKEKAAIADASTKLPELVIENFALHQILKLKKKNAASKAKLASEAASRNAQIESLKRANRVAKLKQVVESSAYSAALQYEDDYEAPSVADFVDDEAVEAKSNDSDPEP
jgi:hypothetical protein